MAATKRKAAEAKTDDARPTGADAAAEGDHVQGGEPESGSFEWSYVATPPKGIDYDEAELARTGAIAMETAALQAGYRPVAKAELVSIIDHRDGVSKVVTWKVAVMRNVGAEAVEANPGGEPSKPAAGGDETKGQA